MSYEFSPSTFLENIAHRLIFDFSEAGTSGTPGLAGSSREHPARKQLEKILPGHIGVGSGLIIDSYGGRSKQQDIVLYEKSVCPVFSINDNAEATYYPVEGVIAVGEVKSGLDDASLNDTFAKSRSVKSLRRHSPPTDAGSSLNVVFRKYGSLLAAHGAPTEAYDQWANPLDSIFSFVLCNHFALTPSTMLQRARDLWKGEGLDTSPSLILSLKDGFLAPAKGNALVHGNDADSIYHLADGVQGFVHLVEMLSQRARHGRTVDISHFQRYLRPDPNQSTSFQVVERLPF